MELSVKGFGALEKAELQSDNNIVVIIAPNRAGKTHILLLLYTIYWVLWKLLKEGEVKGEGYVKVFRQKIKDVFLVKSLEDLVNWRSSGAYVKLISPEIAYFEMAFGEKEDSSIKFAISKGSLKKSPVYLYTSGLGEYYKGILSLRKFYPGSKIVSEAITDLIYDIFVVSVEGSVKEGNKALISLFKNLFDVSFFIKGERIFIKEGRKTLSLERAASGLKAIAWLFLLLKLDLIGEILLIDEPEANLHPIYMDYFSRIIVELAKAGSTKIFLATHSDYLIEGINRFVKKGEVKVDVWEGKLVSDKGAKYVSYEANSERLIDTSVLNQTYLEMLRETFGYGGNS